MAEPEKDTPIIEEIDSEDEEVQDGHYTKEYTVEDIDENLSDESISSNSSTPVSEYSLAEDDSLEEMEGANQNPLNSNQKQKLANKNQPNVNQKVPVANQNPVEVNFDDVDYSDDFSDEDSLEMADNPVDSLDFDKDTDLHQVKIDLDSNADTEEQPVQDEELEDIESKDEPPIPEEINPNQDEDSDELTDDSDDDQPLTARRVGSQDEISKGITKDIAFSDEPLIQVELNPNQDEDFDDLTDDSDDDQPLTARRVNRPDHEVSKDAASASKDLSGSYDSNAGNKFNESDEWTEGDGDEHLPDTISIKDASQDSQMVEAADADANDLSYVSEGFSDTEDPLAVTIKENIRSDDEEPSPIIQVVQLQKPLLDFVQFIEPEDDTYEDVHKAEERYPWLLSPSKDHHNPPDANKTGYSSTAAAKSIIKDPKTSLGSHDLNNSTSAQRTQSLIDFEDVTAEKDFHFIKNANHPMQETETPHPKTSFGSHDTNSKRAQRTQSLIDFEDETDNSRSTQRRTSFQQQFGEELVGDAKYLVGQYQQQLEDALESEEEEEEANQDLKDFVFTDTLLESKDLTGNNRTDSQSNHFETIVEINEQAEKGPTDSQSIDVDTYMDTNEQAGDNLKDSKKSDGDLLMEFSEHKEKDPSDSQTFEDETLMTFSDQLEPTEQTKQNLMEAQGQQDQEPEEPNFTEESKIIDVDSLMEQGDSNEDNNDSDDFMHSSQETERQRHFSTNSHNDEANLNEEEGMSSDSDVGRRLSDDSFGAYDDSSTGSCYSDENVAMTTKMSPAEIVSKYSNEYTTYYESSDDDSIISDVLENVSSGKSVTITSKSHASNNAEFGSRSDTSMQNNGLNFDYSQANPFTEVPDVQIDSGSNFDPDNQLSLTGEGTQDLDQSGLSNEDNVEYLQIPNVRIRQSGTIRSKSRNQNSKKTVPFDTSANISGHITKINNWTYPTNGNVQFKNEYSLKNDNDTDDRRKKFQFQIDTYSDRIPTPIPTVEDENFLPIARKSEIQHQLNFNYNKNSVSDIDTNFKNGSIPSSTVLSIASTLTAPISPRDDCLYSKPNIYYNYQRPASRSRPGLVSSYHQFYPQHEDSVSLNSSSRTQRLEDSVLRDSQDYQILGDDGTSRAKIPARIREIITKNLSHRTSPASTMTSSLNPNVSQLTEENRLLAQELNRVENLLSESAAERDELGIKYNALSERLEQALRGGSMNEVGDAAKSVVQQNLELRRKLEDEHSSYKRKLQSYQDGQQRQAQLVQKLQAKLLQYKKKCQDLEDMIRSKDADFHNTTLKDMSWTDKYSDFLTSTKYPKTKSASLSASTTGVGSQIYTKGTSSTMDKFGVYKSDLDLTDFDLEPVDGNLEKEAIETTGAVKATVSKFERGSSVDQVELRPKKKKMQSTTDSFIEKLENAESRYHYSEADHVMDLETALIKLEEEQQRCQSLTHVNNMLREQLDQATATNQQLSVDIQKLTADWQRARQELETKEAEWREEEKSFNDYFSSEHSRLLALWREVVAFRRQFNDMKVSTERDLTNVRGDVNKASRSVHSACLNLSANSRNLDTQSQVSVDRERAERLTFENQLKDKLREMNEMQARYDAQSAELNARVRELTITNEKLRIQVDEKEKTVSALQKSVSFDLSESDVAKQERQDAEFLHSALRNLADSVINDEEDLEIMDGETNGLVQRARSMSPLRSRSPSTRHRSPGRSMSPRGRSRSPAFVDATFSAVQTALNKRHVQVSELRAKLATSNEHKSNIVQQLDNVESEKRRLERHVMNLKEEMDNVRRAGEDSSRDRERMKNALDVTGNEKSQLEKLRHELNEEIENIHKENEKLQAVNGSLQQQRDQLEEEKEDVKKDKERQIKENERCQKIIDQQDHKMSKIREDYVTTKEALNRALLEKDVLDGQKSEIGEALSNTELQKVELEVEINKLKTEEATLRDALLKMQALNEGLGQDKIELNKIIMMLETDKANLLDHKSALEQDKQGIKEELVKVEQEKMHLETEKIGLNQNLDLCDINRQQLEDEISRINREKSALTEKLSLLARQKDALTDELLQARKECERVQNNLERIIKEKEYLVQEKGELVVQVTATERENRQQSESVSAMSADKDGLESQLYETQQNLMQTEVRKAQLEGENQELIVRKEHLQAEINRLVNEKEGDLEKFEIQKNALNNRLQQVERDLQMALQQAKQTHEEDVERLSRERETQRLDFDSEREETHHRFNLEKDDIVNRLNKEKEELQDNLLDVQRDRDEALLIAENDKQQMLSTLEQEKCSLQERISNLQSDIRALTGDYDKMKMEFSSRQEEDRNNINGLQNELKNFQLQFEESVSAHEREIKNLTNQIRDLARQKEGALKEVAELKTQLKLVEEARDAIRRDLIDANRTIREAEESSDIMRKDIMDLKRSVNDEIREKETVSKTADELRTTVKRAEADKTELNRGLQDSKQKICVLEEQNQDLNKEANDLRSNLRDVEKARLDARRELQELRRQIKMLDGERSKLGKEVVELQTRVAHDEEKDEESRRFSFDLKQKVVETEASREALRKELANMQRKMAELIDEAHLKEKNYHMLLEDSRRNEAKLDDNRNELEHALDNCNAEIKDLRLKLSGSEGRVNALEAALARLEGTKRDIEFKLNSIVSSLRRSIGFRQEMPRGRAMRTRSPSPRRSRSRPTSPSKGFESTYTTTTDGRGTPIPRTGVSPARGESPIRSRGASPVRFVDMSAVDVDPEAVRMALRDFMGQLANAERERDDAISSVNSLTTQLRDLEGDHERTENRLSTIQKSMGAIEEDKRGIDGRLSSAQTALMLQEETIRRNERERKTMSDKCTALERNLTAVESEKRQLEEKLSKMKTNEAKLEDDKKNLKIAFDDTENRCTKLELSRRALEGELQRVKLAMNDKETENQVLSNRVDNLMKQVQDLESKSNSLQLTIDRMSLNLTKTEEEGHHHKDKVQALSMSLSDSNAVISELEDRISQMQRAITNSEHDRRVLQERLEQTRQALDDAKKQNQGLLERIQGIQSDLSESDVRRSELEGHVRQSSTILIQRQESEQELNQKIQKLQQDKQNLADKITQLQRTISDMENAKHEVERSANRLEKDKSALRNTLDKVERERLRTEEMANKGVLERGNLDIVMQRLEDDNVELQRQVQQLQAQLAEAEQQHSQRLIDLTTRHRAETEMETDRLRQGQTQAERLLDARERSNRQRIKGLEEQCSTYRDQLSHELRKRQQFLTKSTRKSEEIRDIHHILDTSLTTVRDSSIDPIILEHESRKLNESLEIHSSPPVRLSRHSRSPIRSASPVRFPVSSFRRSARSPMSYRRSTKS